MPRRQFRMAKAVLRPRVQHEKFEQASILKLAALVCVRLDNGMPAIWEIGRPRSRGKACPACRAFVPGDMGMRQTPGHPDLVMFLKPRGESGPRLLYWESKAKTGTTSDAQDRFLALASQSGANTGVGDYNAFVSYLIVEGYIKADSVPHYRQPAPEARP